MQTAFAKSFRIDPDSLPGEAVIFGRTAAMREVRDRIDRLLDGDLPVLITGESGTGKEVMARFLHISSDRKNAPFVKVNCAAIPGSLLESELLGFEKGAFAGANLPRRGLVEIAEGGTLFLAEIGDMDWSLQVKLLHLLQGGHYSRIGGREERRASIRVVCASKGDLEAVVENRTFHHELFGRIDEFGLHILPLRERKEDIPQLCAYFLRKLADEFGKTAPRLTPMALQLLEEWNWPGNMRELKNWIARVIVLGCEEALGEEPGPRAAVGSQSGNRLASVCRFGVESRHAVSEDTRVAILKVLQANHWNRRKTADELNMSYRSLLCKLRETGILQRRRGYRGFLHRGDAPAN
jgi:two-component system response regulator AtoC